MKRWVRLIVVFFLSIILVIVLPTNVIARPSPENLVEQAQTLYQLGNATSAINLLQRAQSIYQERNQNLSEAQVLTLISLAQQQLGRWEQAQMNIVNSQELLKSSAVSNKSMLLAAQIANVEGHYWFARGELHQALEFWLKAEQHYRQLGDSRGILGMQISQAQALRNLGFYRRACDRTLEALGGSEMQCQNLSDDQVAKVIQLAKDDELSLSALNSMGSSLLLMGKLASAQKLIAACQKRLSGSQVISPGLQAKNYLAIGNVHQLFAMQAKEFDNSESFALHSDQAINYFSRLAGMTATPQILAEQFQGQLNHLSLLIADQQWGEASKLARKVSIPTQSLPNLNAENQFANSLVQLKNHDAEAGYSWEDIANIYLRVSRQARELGNHRAESYALGYLGQLNQEVALSRDYNSEQLLERAMGLAQLEQAPEIVYRWQWQLGRIYESQGRINRAIASYQAALKNLADLRNDLAALTREVQFSFTEQIEPVYRELANLLLLESSGGENLVKSLDVIEGLQIAELDNYFQDPCLTFAPKSIAEIDSQAAIFYTIILPNSLEIVMVTTENNTSRQTYRHHSIPVSQSTLEEAVTKLRLYITEPDQMLEAEQASRQIYQWLLAPFEDDLAVKKPSTLVFVLDGILQTIPMAALFDGTHYLIDDYAIAITPGLRLLNPVNNVQNPTVLAGGVSKFLKLAGKKFPALDSVPQELNVFPESAKSVLLNEEFTPRNLLDQLNSTSASIVHLATHGQFSSNPSQTFLLMWRQLLTVEEFSNLLQSRFKALVNPLKLLVLSACETAAGDRRAALGLSGIAARSGALSTLGTLWQVNEDSTTELMKYFYQNLTNNNKAEALRQAQLKLRQAPDKDWGVPAFWSPYVIIGYWK